MNTKVVQKESDISLLKEKLELRQDNLVYRRGVAVVKPSGCVLDLADIGGLLAVATLSPCRVLIYQRGRLVRQFNIDLLKQGTRAGMRTTGRIFSCSNSDLYMATADKKIARISNRLALSFADVPESIYQLIWTSSLCALDLSSVLTKYDEDLQPMASLSLKKKGCIASSVTSLDKNWLIAALFDTRNHNNQLLLVSSDLLSSEVWILLRHQGQHIHHMTVRSLSQDRWLVAVANYFANDTFSIALEVLIAHRSSSKKAPIASSIDLLIMPSKAKVCRGLILIEDCLLAAFEGRLFSLTLQID